MNTELNEKNALVAEKIMGWSVFRDTDKPNWDELIPSFPCFVIHTSGGAYVMRDNYATQSDEFWSPFTEIKDAFEVVKRMISLGFVQWAICDDEVYFQNGIDASDHPNEFKGGAVFNDGEIEKNICLAALKAIGN